MGVDSRSFSDGRWTPGRPCTRPAATTTAFHAPPASPSIWREMTPSPRVTRSPGCQVFEQRFVLDLDAARGVDAVLARRQLDGVTLGQEHAAVRERRGPHLRTREVGEHRHGLAGHVGGGADAVDALEVHLRLAVSEADAAHVDAGTDQRGQLVGAVAGGPDRRDDLGPPTHGDNGRTSVDDGAVNSRKPLRSGASPPDGKN